MGKSKDLATLKSGLSIDGTLETTSVGTNLTSNSYNIVRVQTDKDDTAAADGILQFTHGSSNTVKGEIRYDASESMFELGHGDNQGHVRIDGSGRVTKPNQPAFFAWNSTTFTGTGIVPFNNTTYNIGNHYSTSTGRFTAPVAGVYLFHVICTSGSSQNATYQFLGKNGSRHRDLFEGDAYVLNSERNASAILSLAANDVVDFRNGGSFSVQGSGNGNYYSAFMGVLLG